MGVTLMSQRSAARVHERVSAGAELYSLCQAAAPDGALSALERERLGAWLERSAECEVPARAFLRELLTHVLQSGRITPADLQILVRVLDPTLPCALRRPAASLRLVGGGPAAWADGTADAGRNDLLASACFMVAGCAAVPRRARAGEPVRLVPARSGAGSESVVEVCAVNGKRLGFVPAQRAKALAGLLRGGARYRAHLIMASCGVFAPVLAVQAFVYRGDAVLGSPQSDTRRRLPRPLSRLSWMLVRASVAVGLAAAAALALRR